MWERPYTKIYKNITKENVWQAWADAANWPKWDKKLEYCKIDCAFVAGAQFVLKPVNGPKVNIVLSEVIPNEKFTDYCKFPGATMTDYHLLEDTPDGLRITNTIAVTGPLGFIWINLVVKDIVAGIPEQLDALVNYARKI